MVVFGGFQETRAKSMLMSNTFTLMGAPGAPATEGTASRRGERRGGEKDGRREEGREERSEERMKEEKEKELLSE